MEKKELPVLVDRSRYETYTCDCQMKRFLVYHYGGKGIVPISRNYHLEVGIAVHEGIAMLLRLLQKEVMPKEKELSEVIDCVVGRFKQKFEDKNREFQKRGMREEAEGTKRWYLEEAIAMIEGLIRVWYEVECEVIYRFYDILAVEVDMMNWLDKQSNLALMTKSDAIMVKRTTGEGVVYNLKTMAEYDEKQAKTRRIAIQNYTEVWGAMKWLSKMMKKGRLNRELPRVWNVRLVGLIKGRSVYNKEMERYEIDGPLVRYWRKKDDTNAQGPILTAVFDWQDNDGNIKRLYGKGYEKLASWKMKGGLKRYLEMFKENKIYPYDNVWASLAVVDGEQMVTVEEAEQKVMQIRKGELEVLQKLKELEKYEMVNEEITWEMLQTCFRPNYNRCYYPSICSHEQYCHNQAVRLNPMDNPVQKFEMRKPHHEKEVKYLG